MNFQQAIDQRGIDIETALRNTKARHTFSYRNRTDRPKYFKGIKSLDYGSVILPKPLEEITDVQEYVVAWRTINHLTQDEMSSNERLFRAAVHMGKLQFIHAR